MSRSASMAPFNISYVTPAVATLASTTAITFRGTGLDSIDSIRYRATNKLRAVPPITRTSTELTADFPCPRTELGAGVYSVWFTLLGDQTEVEYAGSSGDGLRVVCQARSNA